MKNPVLILFCLIGVVAVMAEYDRKKAPKYFEKNDGTGFLLRTKFPANQTEKCRTWEEREYEWGQPWNGHNQTAICRSKCDDKHVAIASKSDSFFCVPIELLKQKKWMSYEPYVRMLGPVKEGKQEPCTPDEEESIWSEGGKGKERFICTKKCRPSEHYVFKNGTCQNKSGKPTPTSFGIVSVLPPTN